MSNTDRTNDTLIEKIEWPEDSLGQLVWRFPADTRFKYGSRLLVRDHQQAVFLAGEEFADIYNPGLYTLTKENMPRFSIFKRWPENFKEAYDAEVFFIKTKYFIDQPWTLDNKLQVSDLQIQPRGSFDIKIINARKIIQKVRSTTGSFTTKDASKMITDSISTLLPDALTQSKTDDVQYIDQMEEVAEFIQESINIELNNYGLLLRNLTIKTSSLKTETV